MDQTPDIRVTLTKGAIDRLASRNPSLRDKNGRPKHSAILDASGVSRTQWWNIRKGFRDADTETQKRLVALDVSSGRISVEESYDDLFTAVTNMRAAA